jgi:hypothetical protein
MPAASEHLTAPGAGSSGAHGLLDGPSAIVNEIGGHDVPLLDPEILRDDGLHDLSGSTVDCLDAGVDEHEITDQPPETGDALG